MLWTLAALSACIEYRVGVETTIPEPVGPILEVRPEQHLFDEVCEAGSVEVRFTNTGDEPLEITSLRFEATSTAFGITHNVPNAGATLKPGERRSATVTFDPSDPEPGEGEITLETSIGTFLARQNATVESPRIEEVIDAGEPAVDVLFSLDTTGSMGVLYDNGVIADALDDFFGELELVTLDWKAAMVWGQDACARSSVLRSESADPLAELKKGLPTSEAEENRTLLNLADVALAQTAPGGCNAQFRRDDAALVVVLLGNSIPEEPDTWADLEQDWFAHVADCRLLTVHALVNNVDFDGSVYPNPYLDAAAATSGVVVNATDSGPPWNQKMATAGSVTGDRVGSFPLRGVPRPGSLEVFVDGEEWGNGFVYDDVAGTLRFVRSLAGAKDVRVSYEIDQCVPEGC